MQKCGHTWNCAVSTSTSAGTPKFADHTSPISSACLFNCILTASMLSSLTYMSLNYSETGISTDNSLYAYTDNGIITRLSWVYQRERRIFKGQGVEVPCPQVCRKQSPRRQHQAEGEVETSKSLAHMPHLGKSLKGILYHYRRSTLKKSLGHRGSLSLWMCLLQPTTLPRVWKVTVMSPIELLRGSRCTYMFGKIKEEWDLGK